GGTAEGVFRIADRQRPVRHHGRLDGSELEANGAGAFSTGALACVADVPPNRLSAVVADAPASKRRRDSEMSITIRLPMHLLRGGRSSARDEPTPTGGRVHDPSKQK